MGGRSTVTGMLRVGVMQAATRAFVAFGMLALPVAAEAQTCTTQARMTPELRAALSSQSLELAAAVKANDSAKVQSMTVAEYASNFGSTMFLIRSTADKLATGLLQVTQAYALNASARKAGDTSEASFSCPLKNSTAEVDFSIPALPPGVYAFTVVTNPDGSRPWMLAFLLRQEGAAWKMAGFYSHSSTAAGHDGVWYWTAARERTKAEPWLAWLMYGEADALLRPVGFMTSTNLDKLSGEQRTAAPPELSDGLSAQTPYVLKGANGNDFRFTSIAAEGSEDGKRLNLMLHMNADWVADPAEARARNTAAAKALLDAHKELRKGFNGVWVFAESAGHDPFATEQVTSDIP